MDNTESNILNDTIAAISTAPGDSGIAIVRISGSASLEIADRVFNCSGVCPSKRPSYTFAHGTVKYENNLIDEVLLLIMRAPHSYTREHVVEIQCHGGVMSARRILRVVLDGGARLAEPGEFTKRAFLNGRIDLLQAEAVLDLIQARSDRCAQAALEQLEGSLSDLFNEIYDSLLKTNAELEATLDFSDDVLPPVVLKNILEELIRVKDKISQSIVTWEEGHLLREGALVVIAGKPNVGKSTLLNELLGKNRVIVSATPGTTRDIIEEGLIINGVPIRLVDTAGLRDSSCVVEKEGVIRAREQMERADIYIYMIDSSKPLDSDDTQNLSGLNPSRAIVVLNKIDLGSIIYPVDIERHNAIEACLIKQKGITEIKRLITEKIGVVTTSPPHAVISERHRQLLTETEKECEKAITLVKSFQDAYAVLASEHIRSALEYLGQVTGRVYYEELLDSIFSRFCVGK